MRPLALRTVLVATDLTDGLLPALRTAAALSQLAGARLHIVHAAPTPEAEAQGLLDAQALLDAQVREAGIDPLRVAEAIVRYGPVGAAVGQEARRIEADVVVLGPHRHDETAVLGNTADHVVRSSEVPCLILPVTLSLPLRTVLAPVHPSAAARGALAVALTWASALRQRRVADGRTRLIAFHALAGESEGREADLEALDREVRTVSEGLSGITGVDVQLEVGYGEDAQGCILEQAERESADLIVLGTRGERTTGRGHLGSVSSAVVRDTMRPVLLVPPAVWMASDLPAVSKPA
jgi:nucleotide-binding universal stress UspA family protein